MQIITFLFVAVKSAFKCMRYQISNNRLIIVTFYFQPLTRKPRLLGIPIRNLGWFPQHRVQQVKHSAK